MINSYETLVVGAGPAGLATSRELANAGLDHIVLERGDRLGHTWANLYDGLVLHTGKHLSALPGLAFPASTPLFPTRRDLLEYLDRYAERFRLPVRTRFDVASLERDRQGWTVRSTTGDTARARAVVIATGIVSNPYVPNIPGRDQFRGRIIHSVEYLRPDAFRGQRVLVVGAGNSSGEIAVELAGGSSRVTVAIRSGARVVPRQLFGIPIQYYAVALSPLPRPALLRLQALIAKTSEFVRGPAVLPPPAEARCSDVPLIGFHLADAVRAGTISLKGGVSEFTAAGARFSDGSEEAFDQVILATGYKAALRMLEGLVRVDDCGFAARRRRVVSLDQPDLYFVGHNYDARGGLRNIAQDARLVARLIRG